MSAKTKPQEGKTQDGSKFNTPKYIKVTPVSISSNRRNGNCSFLQLRVTVDGEGGFLGKQGGKVSGVNYVGRIAGKMMTIKSTLSTITLSFETESQVEGRLLRQRDSDLEKSNLFIQKPKMPI